MEGASKHIGVPYFPGVPLELAQKEVHHLLRLLLRTHDGGHLGFDIRPHHMDGGSRGFEPNPVTPPLFDNLRLLQGHFLGVRHDNAIARLLHLDQGLLYLLILSLHGGHLHQLLNEVPVVVNLQTTALGHRLIEQAARQFQHCCYHAAPHVHAGDPGRSDLIPLVQRIHRLLGVPQSLQLPSLLANHSVELAFDGVIKRQYIHPRGQIQFQLLHREFVEHTA